MSEHQTDDTVFNAAAGVNLLTTAVGIAVSHEGESESVVMIRRIRGELSKLLAVAGDLNLSDADCRFAQHLVDQIEMTAQQVHPWSSS